MSVPQELQSVDAILQRGMEKDGDIAYISAGGFLVFIPADRNASMKRYQLEEF